MQAFAIGPGGRHRRGFVIGRSSLLTTTELRAVLHTVVPPEGDPHGPLAPLLLALTVVTGMVDAVSYLVLGHVFVANMTGNVVFTGFALVNAPGFSLSSVLVAVAAFSLGALAGGRIAASADHRGRALFGVTLVEVALLAVAVVISIGLPGHQWHDYPLIALLAVALGAQNAVVRWLAVPDLTTTVLTLTLTGISADSRLAGGHSSRIGRRLLAVLAMLVGGLLGAQVVLHASTAAALTMPLLLLMLVCIGAWIAGRSSSGWTHVPSRQPAAR